MWIRNEKNKLVKAKPEINVCRYDDTLKHKFCKHQQYCIFNKNRESLERDMQELLMDIKNLKEIYNNLINDEIIFYKPLQSYYDSKDYVGLKNKVKSRINIKEGELIRLLKFEKRIMNGEIKGYGFRR